MLQAYVRASSVLELSLAKKAAIYVPADPFRHLSLGTRLTIDSSSFWQILVALHRLVSSCPTSWSRICTHCPPTEFLPQNPSHKSLTQNSFHNPSLTPITSHPSTNQTLNCRFIMQILLFLIRTHENCNKLKQENRTVQMVLFSKTGCSAWNCTEGRWEWDWLSVRVEIVRQSLICNACWCSTGFYMLHDTCYGFLFVIHSAVEAALPPPCGHFHILCRIFW